MYWFILESLTMIFRVVVVVVTCLPPLESKILFYVFLFSNIHGPWDEAVIKEEHVATPK